MNLGSDYIMVRLGQESKYMHISVDDVYFILKELDESSYKSIYEHKVFRFFKNMHDKYGAVFSLYCFYQNSETADWTLKAMTDRFKEEFKAAASWLKFGFHAYSSNIRYSETIEPAIALEHYKNVITAIRNFSVPASIDIIPRIHFFSGTIEGVRKWRDADNGVKGFLAADDTREVNYYLDALERNHLQNNAYYFEEKENLYFFKTNMRLEKISDSYEALEADKQNYLNLHNQKIKIIFTHEKYLYTQEMLTKIEDCCRWAINNNFIFDFPMNNI